jgi:hypothetical protein
LYQNVPTVSQIFLSLRSLANFGLHRQGIFDKILLKFSKEKTLAGTAINGTN